MSLKEKLAQTDLIKELSSKGIDYIHIGSRQQGKETFVSDHDILCIVPSNLTFSPSEKELLELRKIGFEIHIFLEEELKSPNLNSHHLLVFYDSAFRTKGDFFKSYLNIKNIKSYVHLWSYLSSLKNFNYLLENRMFSHGCKTTVQGVVHFRFLYNFKRRRFGLLEKNLDIFFQNEPTFKETSSFYEKLKEKNFLFKESELHSSAKEILNEFKQEVQHYITLKEKVENVFPEGITPKDAENYLRKVDKEIIKIQYFFKHQ